MNAHLEMLVVFVLAISVVLGGLMAGFFFAYLVSMVLALGTLSSSEYTKCYRKSTGRHRAPCMESYSLVPSSRSVRGTGIGPLDSRTEGREPPVAVLSPV